MESENFLTKRIFGCQSLQIPMRMRSRVQRLNHDDLESEMTKLLATTADPTGIKLPPGMPWCTEKTGVKELDQSISRRELVDRRNENAESVPVSQSLSPVRMDSDAFAIAPLSPTRSRSDAMAFPLQKKWYILR